MVGFTVFEQMPPMKKRLIAFGINWRKQPKTRIKIHDQTWKELTAKNELIPSIETEFKNFHDHVQHFFQETGPIFNKGDFSLLNDPFFAEPKTITEESINKQIEQHRQKIEELQNKKNNMDTEKRKLQLKEEINNKKNIIDVKLDEFAKNLDNDEMKKK